MKIIDNLKSEHIKKLLSKLLSRRNCISCLLLALYLNIYVAYTSTYFHSTRRKVDKYNIFSGNNLSISEEEANKICIYLEKKYPIDDEDIEEEDLLILDAVDKNENFNKYVDKIYKPLINVIEDNPYICKEDVYKTLLNLFICDDKKRPPFWKDNIMAIYDYKNNNVGVFMDDKYFRSLFHEIIHAIFNKKNSLPRFFVEGMTELLTNEYLLYDHSPFIEDENYPFEIVAIKMLCEVTSPEIVLKSFSLGDMKYIINDMKEHGVSEQQANRAIKMLDIALDNYNKKRNDKNDLHDIYVECMSIFHTCVDNKYDDEDHNSISYYYNEMLFYNCLFGENCASRYLNDIEMYGIDYKAYFSSQLKSDIDIYYDKDKDAKKKRLELS